MRTYGLYCNGDFVMAKPFFTQPKSPSDFGIGELPTSCYDIVEVLTMQDRLVASVGATIDVGAKGLVR